MADVEIQQLNPDEWQQWIAILSVPADKARMPRLRGDGQWRLGASIDGEKAGIVATCAGHPWYGVPEDGAGMSLEVRRAWEQRATLHSIFVAEKFRRLGIGSRLMTQMVDLLVRENRSWLEVSYDRSSQEGKAADSFFQKLGWSQPDFIHWAVVINEGNIANLPWVTPQYRWPTMAQGAEIIAWGDVTEDEKKQLLIGHSQNPWIDRRLMPFQMEKGFFPESSVALRRKGEIVGWGICHLLEEAEVQISNHSIRPDLQRAGLFFRMQAEMVNRFLAYATLVGWKKWSASFETPAHFKGFGSVIERRMATTGLEVQRHIRRRLKILSADQLAPRYPDLGSNTGLSLIRLVAPDEMTEWTLEAPGKLAAIWQAPRDPKQIHFALGAKNQLGPVGWIRAQDAPSRMMTVAEMNELTPVNWLGNRLEMQLLGIFVKPSERRKGVASALLKELEAQLRTARRSALYVELQDSAPETPDVIKLLQKNGWKGPWLEDLRCWMDDRCLESLPILKGDRLPHGLELIKWMDVDEEERQRIISDLLSDERFHPWLNPFVCEQRGLEPYSSVAARFEGRVVGWMINRRLNHELVEHAAGFMREDLAGVGWMNYVARESVRRLLRLREIEGIKGGRVAFRVTRYFPHAQAFALKHLRPHAARVETISRWVKQLMSLEELRILAARVPQGQQRPRREDFQEIAAPSLDS